MTNARRLLMIARVCFCTGSPQTLIGVSYGVYVVLLATHRIGAGGDIANLDLCFASAVAGAWIGACLGRVARWSEFRFTPAFVSALGVVSALAAVFALGVIGLLAWMGGLDPRPLAALCAPAMCAGIASGCARPLTMYMLVGIAILLSFTSSLGTALPLPVISLGGMAASVIALFLATMLLARIAFRLRSISVTPPSVSTPRSPSKLLWNRLWEPSMRRIAVWSGTLAAGCTFAHRLPGFEWRDGPLIIVIGSVCVNLGATGSSASLPCGPLPGAAWLLLSGIARTRTDAARRMLWRIVANLSFAAGVFTAVSVALGPDWQLVEMMLVALAASHAYLATACSSRWLMSSRLSVLVATPVVVALAGAVWATGPWGIPWSLAACVVTAVFAVYLGGLGMGRVDLDVCPRAGPAR